MAANDPKGKLVTPVGMDATGNPKALRVNAAGELMVTGGGPVSTDAKARAYLSDNQLNLVDNVWTKVLIDTANYDPQSMLGSNGFTIVTPGYYLVIAFLTWFNTTVVPDCRYAVAVYKNGAVQALGRAHSSNNEYLGCSAQDILHYDVDDVVFMYARANGGVDTVDIFSGSHATFLAIHLLSSS